MTKFRVVYTESKRKIKSEPMSKAQAKWVLARFKKFNPDTDAHLEKEEDRKEV